MNPQSETFSQTGIPFSILAPLHNFPPLKITTIHSEKDYNYYGKTSIPKIISEASEFLSKNTDTEKSAASGIFQEFLETTMKYCNEEEGNSTETCWFTIRISRPSDQFKIPEWHRDGKLFPVETIHSKYSITLLGPPTLILAENKLVNEVMPRSWSYDDDDRWTLAMNLSGGKSRDIEVGRVLRFTWGQVDSPVHSAPYTDRDRVFVSVVYGEDIWKGGVRINA